MLQKLPIYQREVQHINNKLTGLNSPGERYKFKEEETRRDHVIYAKEFLFHSLSPRKTLRMCKFGS
jgi:hypothetical protein